MRVVLTGASGQLGAYLVGRLLAGGHEVRAWSGSSTGERSGIRLEPVDLADPDATSAALDAADPAAVLHAGAVSTAEAVRLDPARARRVNVQATRAIAGWCARRGRRMLYTSTDMVFDGSRPWYKEDDPARPVLDYGRTKLEGEAAAMEAPGAIVARLSLLYGFARCGRPSFFDRAVGALRRGDPQAYFADEFRTPLDLPTAAEALAGLLGSDAAGLVHVGGVERLSRFDLMRRAAGALGIDAGLVRANSRADVTLAEPRPADASLDTTRLAALLPGLRRPTVEQAMGGARETG